MIADENAMGNQAEEWMKLKNIHESSFGVQHSISTVHVNTFPNSSHFCEFFGIGKCMGDTFFRIVVLLYSIHLCRVVGRFRHMPNPVTLALFAEELCQNSSSEDTIW